MRKLSEPEKAWLKRNKCTRCGKKLTVTTIQKFALKHKITRCGKCSTKSSQKSNNELKAEVLTYYGNGKLACIKCGFQDIQALTLDHIEGFGNRYREAMSGHEVDAKGRSKASGGYRLYRWLRIHDLPMGFQTLCANCNFIKMFENNENRWRIGKPHITETKIKNHVRKGGVH